ncbi:MAG: Nucleotide sugar dehydrogenase [Methanothrix harundinacea]|uniref:UDP-N-acetyl-D-mannosamine dehydrogenase n=1 Tax=Methanothrix harundinacea TaxID=301375 RepID=A0A101IL32_9EURY|nr:MAG: Nucleotide sugar dehydrogenase [Methanothrix harundinacea]KUK97146.1 MAG: Nucleotide sugar dehydrogenase [Methanothrix harundinacea]
MGKAGLPLASVVADSGLEVIGIDVDERRCEMINEGVNPIPEEAGLDELIRKHGGKTLIATPRYEDARECTNFIIIVPLFIDEGHRPDYSILEGAFRNVGKILKRGDLVVLETTVPPTTTETIVREWLEGESDLLMGDFYLAYSPERIMTGYSISRLRGFPKIIGGVDEMSGTRAFELYEKFIPNLQKVSSSRTAEFVKIIEGSYRDVNIALANEIFKIAEELEIDFYEARSYANHEYCHIHLPSTGVGGHCIPVYPWFLINEMEKREKFSLAELQRTSRKINDEMAGHWAEKIILGALKIDRPLSQVKICLKGITYRKGVKGIYHSRNLALAKLLARKELRVGVYDDLFSKEEIESLGLNFMNPGDADLVFDCFELSFSQ